MGKDTTEDNDWLTDGLYDSEAYEKPKQKEVELPRPGQGAREAGPFVSQASEEKEVWCGRTPTSRRAFVGI